MATGGLGRDYFVTNVHCYEQEAYKASRPACVTSVVMYPLLSGGESAAEVLYVCTYGPEMERRRGCTCVVVYGSCRRLQSSVLAA